MADYTKNKNLELPKSNEHYDVGVANKNNMVIDSELHKLDLKNQSQDNLLATKESLNEHITDKNNPHNVTKYQIGLGNVDNTSDLNKPVSTEQQTAIDEALYQSNYYTDTKIAELINGAPETLDTLKEIADAIEENETIVEALDAAIGAKANQSELDTHINNNVIHVTQTDKNNWNVAKTHAESKHARVDATKVQKSENNGNIIIDGKEINVYTPDILNTIQSVDQNNSTGKLVDALVIKEVFQSVSDGKSKIASAITDKGVQTDATDTFQTMADNIDNIQVGGNVGLKVHTVNTSYGYTSIDLTEYNNYSNFEINKNIFFVVTAIRLDGSIPKGERTMEYDFGYAEYDHKKGKLYVYSGNCGSVKGIVYIINTE